MYEDILRVNLNSEYKTLNFDLGGSGIYNKNGGFKIFLDDKLYKEFEVTLDKDIENITVDVTGVNQLRFEFPSTVYREVSIGNPILTK